MIYTFAFVGLDSNEMLPLTTGGAVVIVVVTFVVGVGVAVMVVVVTSGDNGPVTVWFPLTVTINDQF